MKNNDLSLKPLNEGERLIALQKLNILDSDPEQGFDDITNLARQIFGVPIALISLVDENRQWFKSCDGLSASETGRDIAFCAHTILSEKTMVVNDATKDERFKNNPLVTGDTNIRFYAGAPLIYDGQYNLGTLCIIDTKPHKSFGADKIKILETLAANIVNLIMLRDTNSNLNTSNLAKSEFFSNFSHEIRTPLNAIMGLSKILSEQPELTEKSQKFINMISVSSNSLAELMNSVIDLAAIEENTFDLNADKFSLYDLCNEIQDILGEKASEKGLTFHVKCDELYDLQYYGDKVRMRQVLINLVNNAIKFTQRGSVMLNARLDRSEDPHKIIIDVIDTGVGLSEINRRRIFDRFYQVKDDDSHLKGSGLGLTITKKIVDKLEGKIELESALGLGTKFTITLPDRTIKKPIGILESEKNTRLSLNQQFKILLVEDCLTQKEVIGAMLKDLGYQIYFAVNGDEALSLTADTDFDLILMDINLPDSNGFDISTKIKQNEKNKSVPIIGTSSTKLCAADLTENSKLDSFMPKPIALESLSNQIKSALLH